MQAAASYHFLPIRVRRRSARMLRRARTLSVLAVLVILAGVLVFAPRSVHTMPRTVVNQVYSYTVAPGETLWEIAAQFSNGKDVRRVIASIKRENRLQTAQVYPGQVLAIPVGQGR